MVPRFMRCRRLVLAKIVAVYQLMMDTNMRTHCKWNVILIRQFLPYDVLLVQVMLCQDWINSLTCMINYLKFLLSYINGVERPVITSIYRFVHVCGIGAFSLCCVVNRKQVPFFIQNCHFFQCIVSHDCFTECDSHKMMFHRTLAPDIFRIWCQHSMHNFLLSIQVRFSMWHLPVYAPLRKPKLYVDINRSITWFTFHVNLWVSSVKQKTVNSTCKS